MKLPATAGNNYSYVYRHRTREISIASEHTCLVLKYGVGLFLATAS